MNTALAVQILRYVSDHQPGWIESKLVDADGKSHIFTDKVPIFTCADLDAKSKYPQPGEIRCEAVSESKDLQGRALITIDTVDGVESTGGLSRFVVAAEQISDYT
jgi:hypothetical protein